MTPDEFWRYAMGQARRAPSQLSVSQQIKLLPIRWTWRDGDSHDHRWWAAVGEVRADGAIECVPLTVDRLDTYLAEFERTGVSTPWSMSPTSPAYP